MGSTTAAGSALAISAAHPATEDEDGYDALTYTEIGQIEKIGGIGSVFAKVEFQPLKGPKQKHKGSVDYGSLQPSLAHDDDDAGQTLLRTAADNATSALYSFKATYPSGAVRYFQGRVFGYPENIDGADTIVMAAPTIEICTKIVKVDPA
ncbi:MAG TPA: hypothetical protein VFJ46_17540 [Xanthobacteraceae bacterium]|nr:hypothetical protein [Xanthobacteraceae bacterium]